MNYAINTSWNKRLFVSIATTLAILISPLTSAFAEGENVYTTQEEVKYQIQEFDVTIDKASVDKTNGNIYYNATPSNPSKFPKNASFRITLNENYTGTKMKKPEVLNGKRIMIQVQTEVGKEVVVGEKTVTEVYLHNWYLLSGAGKNEVHEAVKLDSMRFLEEGVYQYDVTRQFYNKPEIDRVVFYNSRLKTKHPVDQNLADGMIMVSGIISTSDNKTMEVHDWIFIEEGEPKGTENTPAATYEIHGQVVSYLYKETTGANGRDYVEWVEFEDSDGKRYLARWNPAVLDKKRAPSKGYYTFTVSTITNQSSKPMVNIESVLERAQNFEFKTDDVVALTGYVGKNVSGNNAKTDGTTVVTYEFVSKERTYYASFDSTILGNYNDLWKLSGKSLELTGVVYKKENKVFLGVMGYRDPFADSNYKEGIDKNKSSRNIISATPVHIISHTDKQSSYKVVTKDGLEHTFIFDSSLMKKFPNRNLISETFNFTVIHNEASKKSGVYYVVDMTPAESQEFATDRGLFVKLVKSSASTHTFLFESVNGAKYNVIMNNASVDTAGGAKQITGSTANIYGNHRTVEGVRLFDVYMYSPLNVGHINKNTSDKVSFRGKIQKVVSRDNKGIMFYGTNQYGQSEYFYMEKDFLGSKFPVSTTFEELFGYEISVSGYRMKDGAILVNDFGYSKVPKHFPAELKPLVEAPVKFPNLKGWTGILDISDIAGEEGQLMLITATDKYILHGKANVMKDVEKNLRNIVYLRGEYREAGKPYWTGEIEVYDLQFVDKDTNTIVKPIGQEVDDIIPDPQKEAIHTLQPHKKPKEFEFGSAIPEALYFPELPQVADPIPNGK